MSKSAIIWWKVKKDKRRNGNSTQSAFFWMGWELPEGSQGRDRGDALGPCGKSVNTIGMLLYALCRELNTACTDSPPCSPRNPKPPPFLYKIHCMVFQKVEFGVDGCCWDGCSVVQHKFVDCSSYTGELRYHVRFIQVFE